MAKCIFHDCKNPIEKGRLKCIFHHNRVLCTVIACRNQAYARGKCVRHGARKRCPITGCLSYCRRDGFCTSHTTNLNQQNTMLEEHEPEPLTQVARPLTLNAWELEALQTLLQEDDDSWNWAEIATLLAPKDFVSFNIFTLLDVPVV